MKRQFLTKKEARELVKELPIAYHDYGRHVGLHVKVYKFPKLVEEILWESLLLTEAFESSFGTVGTVVWELTKEKVKKQLDVDIYSTGRYDGYWGFWVSDLKKQGISQEKAIRTLRKSLAEALHTCFGGPEVELLRLGQDLNPSGTETAYMQILCHLDDSKKGYRKEVRLDGVEQWVNLKEDIEELVQDMDYQGLAKLWKDFDTAWQMRHVVCSYSPSPCP